jgi:hypothetical protein
MIAELLAAEWPASVKNVQIFAYVRTEFAHAVVVY